MRSTSLVACSLAFATLATLAGTAACGGKIADDPEARGGSSGSSGRIVDLPAPTLPQDPAPTPSPAPSFQPPSTPTSPSKPTVEDACKTVCDRNGQCGALQDQCYARCTEEIHSATSCTSEASAYIHCYANNLEGCSALPPVCEAAYCAFTRCAGRVVPRYCP